jgi:serine/threonine protein kinase/lipopolysaccharide biosynthesis regulator YciM
MVPKSIDRIFWDAARLASPTERAAYLDHACAGDGELRRRVEQLLQARAEAEGFLEAPAPDLGPTTATRPPREGPGTILGPYKLLEQIGEGGFGLVFLAEQQQPVRRKVALKVLKPGMDTRQVVARFEAERQALALMDHPNIAKVLDAGETTSGRPYFVMDLARGLAITAFCDQNRLPPRERLGLFVSVCQAVQHAHQKGVIHRDLKPSNVLVTLHDGTPMPKVIDFGVAKALGQQLTEKTLFTNFVQMIGTPLYMSPEQAAMSGLDIDTRSDIYSLGVLLYELLTGTTPFDQERLRQAGFDELRRILHEEEPPTPSTRVSTAGQAAASEMRQSDPQKLSRLFRGELDWVVMKALEKDRNRRYESASAFAADVQRYLNDEPVQACPPSAWYRFRKFARRHKAGLAAAGAAAVAVLVAVVSLGAATLLLQAANTREREARGRAEQNERAADEQRRQAVAQQGRAEAAERVARERLAEVTRQKERTEEEAAVGRAVNEFLQKDLLRQADIGNQPRLGAGAGRDRNITVGELLDRAAAAIEGRFATQPLTEAAIRLTVGDTYLQLGRYAESERHLDRALALRTAQLGPDHPAALAGKRSLALLYHAQGKDGRAERLLQEVLSVRTAQFGEEHPDRLVTKTDLAVLYRFRGEYDRAESLLQEVLAAQLAKLGADHPDTLGTKNYLALLYHARGKDDRAEALHKEVLEGRIARLGADHPDTLWSKNNLAVLYRSQGRHDRAEPLFERVLAARAAKLGPDHPDTLWSKNNLALLFRARGEYGRAEPLFREVLAARTARLGPDHPETLWSKNNLALLFRAREEYDRAEPLFREVLAARAATLGDQHPDTLWSKNNLAGLYEREGQYARAEVLYKEALEGRARLSADNPDTLWSKNNLAVLYRNWGKYERAEPLFREAVEGGRRTLGLAHPSTQTFIRNRVDCYEKMGQPGRGEPLLRELADFWKNKAGAGSPEYAAELSDLGRNLVQQKKYAEAEPLLLAGYAGMRKRMGNVPQEKARLTEAAERLVQIYEATGDKDQAAQWQQRLEAHREARKKADGPR